MVEPFRFTIGNSSVSWFRCSSVGYSEFVALWSKFDNILCSVQYNRMQTREHVILIYLFPRLYSLHRRKCKVLLLVKIFVPAKFSHSCTRTTNEPVYVCKQHVMQIRMVAWEEIRWWGERYLSAKDIAPHYLKESERPRDIYVWYRYLLAG
jgi:hypothetical protein